MIIILIIFILIFLSYFIKKFVDKRCYNIKEHNWTYYSVYSSLISPYKGNCIVTKQMHDQLINHFKSIGKTETERKRRMCSKCGKTQEYNDLWWDVNFFPTSYEQDELDIIKKQTDRDKKINDILK